MGSFRASFIVEVEKMYRKKKARVIIILSIITIAFVQLLSTVIRSGLGIIGNTASGFPITVLSVFSNTLLPLFTALAVIDTFTGEFSRNTMKLAVTKPVSRIKIYASKLSATAFFVFANLMIVLVLSVITGAIFNSEALMLSNILKAITAYVVTIFPIMVLAIIIAFMANVFRSSSLVFFLSIILFAASFVLGLVFSSYSNLFITSSIDWYRLWIADSLPIGSLILQFTYMAGYAMIFFTAGFYVFDRRDL